MNKKKNKYGLTALQETFCRILSWERLKSYAEAVLKAGYKPKNRVNAAKIANQLRNNPRVRKRLIQIANQSAFSGSLNISI